MVTVKSRLIIATGLLLALLYVVLVLTPKVELSHYDRAQMQLLIDDINR